MHSLRGTPTPRHIRARDNLFQPSVRNLPHKQALDNVPKHIVKTVHHISLPARTSQRPNRDVHIGWDARAVRFQTRNQCTAVSYPEAGTFNLAGRLHIKICITTHTHTTERYTCTDRAAHPSHTRAPDKPFHTNDIDREFEFAASPGSVQPLTTIL